MRAHVKFDQPLAAEALDPIPQIHMVIAFDSSEIDSTELSQAEEKLLFQSLRGRNSFDIFAERNPPLDARDVLRRVVHIRPSPLAIEGMCAGAEAEVRFAPPIFQIVLRTPTLERPI